MDNTIALQSMLPKIDSPIDAQSKALQLRQLLNAGQASDFQLHQQRQAQADDEAARAAFRANPSDSAARLSALAQVSPKAYAAEAKAQSDLAKAGADTKKTQLETAKQHIDLAGQAFGFVRNNPTPENALAAIQHLAQNGVFSPEQVQQYTQQVQSNPNGIKALAEQGYTNALAVKDQLAKIDTRDTGGAVQTIGTNPVTGQVTQLSSMGKTQSPDSIASNAVSTENSKRSAASSRYAADTSAATVRRGQDLTSNAERNQVIESDNGPVLADKRTGATRPILGANGQSLVKTKPLTEFQGKSAAFGDRALASDKILNDIGMDYSPAALSTKASLSNAPLIGGIVGAAANSLLGSNDQRVEQAQRDFINATLRQESGAAISPGEFENARKQYFPQPGDGPEVIKQKSANRQLVIKGFKRSSGQNANVPDSGGVIDFGSLK